MLFKTAFLNDLLAGKVTSTFRRWMKPRVHPGSQIRTQAGVVMITAVDVVDEEAITDQQARQAGFSGREDLHRDMKGDGLLFRIQLRMAGDDPRIALREKVIRDADELEELKRRLARMGSWTMKVLLLIDDRPATRAAELADTVGQPLRLFKTNVRKLKELGLTESLEVGYRLSPRGRAFIDQSR